MERVYSWYPLFDNKFHTFKLEINTNNVYEQQNMYVIFLF